MRAARRGRSVILAALAALHLGGAVAGEEPPPARRVVVLAFDGVDPELARRWIDEGKLPNLAALARQGTFAPLATTNPAQSPTSWATFLTGTNPGKTRIFGFLRRRPGTYEVEPTLGRTEPSPWAGGRRARLAVAAGAGALLFLVQFAALSLALRRWRPRARALAALPLSVAAAGLVSYAALAWLPETVPAPVNLREGEPFWNDAARAGFPVVALGAPLCYPPDEVAGCELLCGFGVPDLKGTMGYWTLYTSAVYRERESDSGGLLVPIAREGRVESAIPGPDHLLLAEERDRLRARLADLGEEEAARARERLAAIERSIEVRAPFDFQIDRAGGAIDLAAGGRTRRLAVGEWSEWISIEFRMNALLSLHGMARFYLARVVPEVELYLTPVQFHPRELPPRVRISSPSSLAGELWEGGARYPTVGWPTATNALKDERLDERAFLLTARQEFESQRELTLAALSRDDWRLLVSFFYTPDRVSHMMWRFQDPLSPRYDAALAAEFGDAILDSYRWMDEIVGAAIRRAGEGTAILVVSDHGFRPFRKGVHLNAWLRDAGFLALAEGPPGGGLERADWTRTRAYSIGLGEIFVNLAGREPRGTVEPADYDRVCREIVRGLEGLRDPGTGEPAVVRVYDRSIYHGDHVGEAADLVVGFASGYRVSWETTLGGIPEGIVSENRSKWSGEHVSVDPSLVPGVFLSTLAFDVRGGVAVQDIAPTILALLGLPPREGMDGRRVPMENERP